jgi:hypothetical protein
MNRSRIKTCRAGSAMLVVASVFLGEVAAAPLQEFALLKGKGVPVCDAYLERLNASEYKSPVPCDRPETDRVPGFAVLSRVELSKDEFNRLHKSVDGFLANQNPSYWDNLNRARAERGSPPRYKESADQVLGRREMPYRFDPPVDIDNDETPDNVVIWRGYNECGGLYPERRLEARYAIVLTQGGASVDVDRTRRLFAHPKAKDEIKQGLPAYFQGVSRNPWDFDALGHAFGVFRYEGSTYFDTFLGMLGDPDGKSLPKDGNFRLLSAFVHEGDATKEVCRFRWNNSNKWVYL